MSNKMWDDVQKMYEEKNIPIKKSAKKPVAKKQAPRVTKKWAAKLPTPADLKKRVPKAKRGAAPAKKTPKMQGKKSYGMIEGAIKAPGIATNILKDVDRKRKTREEMYRAWEDERRR